MVFGSVVCFCVTHLNSSRVVIRWKPTKASCPDLKSRKEVQVADLKKRKEVHPDLKKRKEVHPDLKKRKEVQVATETERGWNWNKICAPIKFT